MTFSQWKYDVFLSFSGDTRKRFTDHLNARLKRNGFITFRDEQNLERGEMFAPELLKAIGESCCSVIVFSEGYASSSWCLDELVEIYKQQKEKGRKIFPVFYHILPSELRRQNGSVGEAFVKHESRYSKEKIKSWREALSNVPDIYGWHLEDSYESGFIEGIVRKISIELNQTSSSVPSDFIGIHSRLDELRNKIDFGKDDVRVVGICGMGGIGKTTLARVVYNQMSVDFEGKCFLECGPEGSKDFRLVSLQQQLLSEIFPGEDFPFFNDHDGKDMISRRLRHKKVLLVIDNVDNIQRLNRLAKERDWFGPGSRIIVTTRDEQVLRAYKVDDVYRPTKLNASESRQLFLKAFENDTLENDFMSLSQSFLEYADGLPLALEVLGRDLYGRDAACWRNAIGKSKVDLKEEIHNCLYISYEGLDEMNEKIFLDIAHFFNGEDKDFVTIVLDGCEYYPDIGLDDLIKKSLITIEDNKIWMHKLLQEMGRKIVRQKSPDEPGKRCRLTEEKDVNHVLTKNLATEAIEGMVINSIARELNGAFTWNADEAFLKMTKLRLLIVHDLLKSFDITYLSSELRLFKWHKYPLKVLPSGFQPENFVALVLPDSGIEQLCEGEKSLNKLKVIDLRDSPKLIKTPNFEKAKNLESLNLEGCTNLVDIHSSIACLPKLKLLNLRNCTNLKSLPTLKGMESLETLILSGCRNLQRFPEIAERMECLLKLCLDGTGIEELPSSVGHLSSLVFLDLKDCGNLVSLPSNINGLECLKLLDISGCSELESLTDFRMTKNLESLNLGRHQRQLSEIDGCASLETVPYPANSYNPSSGAHFYCVNCFKFAAKDNALRMLKGHLKAAANARRTFDLVIPGSKIFEWFADKKEECSVTISNLQKDIQWRGFALCCVLVPAFNKDAGKEKKISYNIIIHFEDFECKIPTIGFLLNSKSGQISEDHLWLCYLPRDILDKFLEDKSGQHEILQSGDWIRSCIRIEILFETLGFGSKVNKCGARLVCPGDLEDMDPAMERPSTSTSP